MALNVRSTTKILSWFACLLVCSCAFLPIPELAVLACAESMEGECPCHEDARGSEEELVVCSSIRRRLSDQRHRDRRWPHVIHQVASDAGRLSATVGHQLANGLCAPLLI